MAQPIKVPMLIRTGEARQPRRMARRSTRNITPALTEPSEQPRAQMATSTRPRTAMPTRTQGVAGRRRVPILMLHTVGEAAVDRTITAAAHRRSAGGVATQVATPDGGLDLRALRAGEVVAAGAVGAAVAVVAGAAVVRPRVLSQESRESGANGGAKCSTYSAIVHV